MIAYKGFRPGLICRGYQFVMGLNTTEKANCRENGFHCAENPLDCLSYYSSLEHSEYYIVNAGGDIDEDEHDSKIACTELTVIKRLTKEELFLHGLAYMVDHPRRVWSSHVAANRAMANCGYAVVRGKDPVATGKMCIRDRYETVIMPLLKAHTIMMYRNLLYTGITRAKKRVVLIGQKQVLFMAIHRNEIGKRNTLLGMRIQMYFKAYAKKAGIPIPAALEEQLKNAS